MLNIKELIVKIGYYVNISDSKLVDKSKCVFNFI